MIKVRTENVEPLFKVGDIVTDAFDEPGFDIEAGVFRYEVTEVSPDYDSMNGYIYTIYPADENTKEYFANSEDFSDMLNDGAEICGFEGTDEACQMMLAESISVSESKIEDTKKFLSMQLSGIEDQGLANVLRKIAFMPNVDWSYVNKLVKTYMPEAQI